MTATSDDPEDPSLRRKIGAALSSISDLINSNIIIVRYGTLGSIILLGAYGISNTPLFYRYRSLWDIPESMWTRRGWVHGRIVGVVENRNVNDFGAASRGKRQEGLSALLSTSLQQNDASSADNTQSTNLDQTKVRPVVILFRHSSFIERLLTQSAMDRVLSFTGQSPSRMFYSSTNPRRNLLSVELAGVSYPPYHSTSMALLNNLAGNKTRVCIQLIAQRASATSLNPERRISEEEESTALCHVTYQKPNQWLSSTNLGLELITSGQATISSALIPESDGKENKLHDNVTIINFNPTTKQLQQDATFMSQLEEAEYSAWKSRSGIWSLESTRELLRPEYKEEEIYVSNLWSTKVWKVMKMGWSWIRR